MELDGRGDYDLHRFQKEKKSCRKSKREPDCKTLQGSHMS